MGRAIHHCGREACLASFTSLGGRGLRGRASARPPRQSGKVTEQLDTLARAGTVLAAQLVRAAENKLERNKLRARFAFPWCPVVLATCTAREVFLKHARICC